jgi:transformation/transcription domain-associated protein
MLLTTIQRLPHSENMKQFVAEIQNLMVHLLRTDNEELGVICVKIVIDFNRTYRALLDPYILPFIEWINELYNGMPQLVEKTFKEDGTDSIPNTSSTSLGNAMTEVRQEIVYIDTFANRQYL